MMTCQLCGESERRCRRPVFDGDLEDEADELRRWRRDAAAEAALPLPGLEPGIETISAEENSEAARAKPSINQQDKTK
jgi:hypothetical protein